MPVITCHVSADTGSDEFLEDLSTNWWRLQQEDVDTDLILVSGQNRVNVHQAVLLPLSAFLRDLVPVNCPCTTPALTLPLIQGDTLSALVEVIYTGMSNVGSKTEKVEFVELIKSLQIGIDVQYSEANDRYEQVVGGNSIIHQVGENKQTIHQAGSSKPTVHQKGGILPTVKPEGGISPTAQTGGEVLPIVQQLEGRMITVQKVGGITPIVTDLCEQPNFSMKNNQIKGSKSPNILSKTTRSQKRKIQSILNESKESDLPERKKKRLDLTVQQTGEKNKFINVKDILDADVTSFASAEDSSNGQDVVPDPNMILNVQDDATVDSHIFSEKSPVSMMEQSTSLDDKMIEEEVDFFKDNGEEQPEKIKDRVDKFSCPFCFKEFEQKKNYTGHISWMHFKEELAQKFPGLKCQICKKLFVKQSYFVCHLGTTHKIIDDLMQVNFAAKMAQIKEAEQLKSFGSFKRSNVIKKTITQTSERVSLKIQDKRSLSTDTPIAPSMKKEMGPFRESNENSTRRSLRKKESNDLEFNQPCNKAEKEKYLPGTETEKRKSLSGTETEKRRSMTVPQAEIRKSMPNNKTEKRKSLSVDETGKSEETSEFHT